MPGRLLDDMDDFPELQLPESRVLIIITGTYHSSLNYDNAYLSL